MKLSRPITLTVDLDTKRNGGQTAFTMIEIAISLAIIGFALVAIIGVLPLGLSVQRENREETIVNHDVGIFMDAIRTGSRGMDDLTNYVFAITNSWTVYDTTVSPWTVARGPGADGYDLLGSDASSPTSGGIFFPIRNGFRIVGLLGRPKLEYYAPGFCQSNHTVAYVRAMSGPASEKFPQSNPSVKDLGFSYRLVTYNTQAPAFDTNSPYGKNLQANLHELRLLFRWPLLPNGDTGNGRQSYRSLVGGQLVMTTDPSVPVHPHPVYFFQPNTFTTAP